MDQKGWSNGLRGGGESTPLNLLKGKSMVVMGSKSKANDQPRTPADDLTPLGKTPHSIRQLRTGHHQQQQSATKGPANARGNRQAGPSPLSAVAEAQSPRGSIIMSPRESIASMDVFDEQEIEGESVQVFVRVRPASRLEEERYNADGPVSSVSLRGTREINCHVPGREAQRFIFDQILWHTDQADVFEVAGIPMVDNCMAGYNSSIFAYGQTGAGKTHTMMGVVNAPGEARSDLRGLAPRVFEYLFEKISQEEDAKGIDSVRFNCRCSFLEIYNETITDLLNPSANGLPIREDVGGCFVEGLTLTPVQNEDDVLMLMRKGAENRHVGETRMNRESSRSHSVFTCIVEKSSKSGADGVTSVIVSRLNLIDLAGSERIMSGAMGGSQAQGTHFKEAVHINKSLTTLGRVISELVEAQRSRQKRIHIPYRDSRLTFLLQDSLGGNAKTMIIANVSPSPLCAHETMTTLQFVQRAKRIRNKAHINMDIRGDVTVLQKEIARLNKTISDMKQNNTAEVFKECQELREALNSAKEEVMQVQNKLSSVSTESKRYQRERDYLEKKIKGMQDANGDMEQVAQRLARKVEAMSQAMEHEAAARQQAAQVEAEIESARQKQLDALQSEAHTARSRLEASEREISALKTAAVALEASIARLESDKADLTTTLQAAEIEAKSLQERMAAAQEQLTAAEQRCADEVARVERFKSELETAVQNMSSAAERESELQRALSEEQGVVARLQGEVETVRKEVEGAREQAASDLAAARSAADAELAAARADAAAALQAAVDAERAAGAAREGELAAARDAVAAAFAEERGAWDAERAVWCEEKRVMQGELAQRHDALTAAGQETERLSQELQTTKDKVAELESKLQDESKAHTATQLELSTHVASSNVELAKLQQQRDSLNERLGQLEKQLHESSSELETQRAESVTLAASLRSKSEETVSVTGQLQELSVKLVAAEAAAAQLQDELNSVKAAGDDKAQQAERLQQTVTELQTTTQRLQSELHTARESASTQDEARQREIARLKEELDSSQRSVETLTTDMEKIAETLKQEQAATIQTAQSHQAEAQALSEQKQALQSDLATLQQRLSERDTELDRLKALVDDKTTQITALQKQVSQKDIEVEAAQKATKLAQQIGQAEIKKRDQIISKLQQELKESEIQARVYQSDLTDKLRNLQHEIISKEEKHTASQYELSNKVKDVQSQLDTARRELQQQHKLLENRSHELQAAKNSLATLQDNYNTVKALVSDRDRELSEATRRAAEERDAAQVERAKDRAIIEKLSEELDNVRMGRGDMEAQMKNFLVTNTRQTKAFQEIRRLIEWATTPPSSARSSVGIPGADGTPGGMPTPAPGPGFHAAALDLPGRGGDAGDEDGTADGGRQRGASTPPTSSPRGGHGGMTDTRAIAALLRLRSSLTLMTGQSGALDELPPASPGGAALTPGALAQSPFLHRTKASGAGPRHSPRRRLDAAGGALRGSIDVGATSLSLSKMVVGYNAASAAAANAGTGGAAVDGTGASPGGLIGTEGTGAAEDADCDIRSPRALLEIRDQTVQI